MKVFLTAFFATLVTIGFFVGFVLAAGWLVEGGELYGFLALVVATCVAGFVWDMSG